jgi:soluble lytic murein transglycosylase
MIRFVFKFTLCLLLAVAASFAYRALRSGDPAYVAYEWISPARFRQYDRLIRSVALKHDLDPMLVKAVIWRESRFDPQKYGTAGERGLMQVSEKAANEWVRENSIENFRVEELFDPRKNLEAGAASAQPVSADQFLRNIDFPNTRNYVDSIIDRYHFYRRRGKM